MKAVNQEPGDRVGFNLEAIRQIQTLAPAAGAEFVLAMIPLLREICEPGPRDYQVKAPTRLTEFTKDQQITYLDILPMFNRTETPEMLYRDHIHLSPQGNQKVSEVIGRSLQPLLSQATPPQ
jgi:lysophospholipase L1-like esterase